MGAMCVCVVCVREREGGEGALNGAAQVALKSLAEAGATLEHAGGNTLKACARLQCFALPCSRCTTLRTPHRKPTPCNPTL